MIDSIQAFGDSFLFGSDLNDSDNKIKYSLNTWPALVASKLSLTYECYARGGRGNHNILNNVLNYSKKSSLVIINWSWIDRFDYHTVINDHERTIRPGEQDEISEFFYKHLHTEKDDKFRSLSYIYTAHQYLKNNNIPFIATYMDQLLLDSRWNISPGMIKLQEIIKKDLKTFPNDQTFLEWSRANNYPESEGWHPLERAHEEAAKIWLPIYEKEISKHITTK